MSNYELVPPKSKLVSFNSAYLPAKGDGCLTFKLKVFDFKEDEKRCDLMVKHAILNKDGSFKKDKYGSYVIKDDDYYIALFKLGVKEIKGLEGKKFIPQWPIMKEIVQKIIEINTAVTTEK